MNDYVRDYSDILECISEALSPDEIIDRLGLSSVELCDKLSEDIARKLGEFEDVYSAGDYDDPL